MKKLIAWLEDQVLARLQRRCQHPGKMVAVDILEGSVDGLEVRYCRRCGSVKTDWKPDVMKGFARLDHTWRRPDPNMWRD
jgi:hypothetical protein